jgi:spore maturation protein CgeB
VIPYAADSRLNFPTDPVAKYQYDIVYLGAYLPQKKRAFEEVLLPLRRKYRVGVFGPYWTWKDNVLRVGQRVSRDLNSAAAMEFFYRKRIEIPEEEENQLYSSAKIGLNFHERKPDGSQPHYVLNQRTFKIPACGGFEICDYVPALRKYFDDDEVVMADSGRDFLAKIEYYLTHDDERRAIQANGTAKALKCHTYHQRVRQVLSLALSAGQR